MSRRIVAVFAVLVATWTAGEARADFWSSALQDFRQQMYNDQLRAVVPAARQGDARSQYQLGLMYQRGNGVPQDYAEAARWYRRSADQGFAPSQYRLGAMYSIGQGVPESNMKAHVWLNLAAGHGILRAREYRDIIAGNLSAEQIAEAQRLARIWRPTPPRRVAP